MDELTLLRSTRDDTLVPTDEALERSRALLLERAGDLKVGKPRRLPRRRPLVARMAWALTGVAAITAGVVAAGNLGQGTPPASAAQILLERAAAETIKYSDPVAGPGQYLHLRQFGRWNSCSGGAMDVERDGQLVHTEVPYVCEPYDDTRDLYVPADPSGEWVWHMTTTGMSTMPGTESTRRAMGGASDGVDLRGMYEVPQGIPTDGDAAYAWIDAQYQGGSSNRDEDNFTRITDILRSGFVPAAQRAALLAALAKIPGVTATEGVANLDGVQGVAIGRSEPARQGQRQEIIIDPDTGLVLGERTLAGAHESERPWGPDGLTGLTAVELTVVDAVPALSEDTPVE